MNFPCPHLDEPELLKPVPHEVHLSVQLTLKQVPQSKMVRLAKSPGPQNSHAFLIVVAFLLTKPFVCSQPVHFIAPG